MEDSPQENIAKMQIDQQQLEALTMQMGGLEQSLQSIMVAKHTLSSLPEAESETIVPINGGIFLPVKLLPNTKVLMDVGSGAVIEKDADEAVNFLEKREEEIKSAIEKYREATKRLSEQIMGLREKIEGQIRQQQQGPDVPLIG